MKKFTLSLVVSVLAVPGIMSATDFKISQTRQEPERKAALKTRGADDVIWTAPEGEHLKFERSGITFSLYKEPFIYDNSPQDMVVCENGDVYLQAPFFSYAQPTYIVGHTEGDKVIFNLPQTVVYEDYGGGFIYSLDATLGQYDENAYTFVGVNTEKAAELGLPEVENKLVMTIKDGVYTYDSGLPIIDGMLTVETGDMILCMCDSQDGSWFGPAEVTMILTPFNEKPLTPPADLVTEPMEATYNSTGNVVEVGFDGNEVFIKGLVSDFPESWIKGTIDGDICKIPSRQYLGESFRYASYIYYSSATLDKETGLMTLVDSVDLYYNPETKTFIYPENIVGLYNGALDYVHYIEMYENLMIRPQLENPEISLNAPYDIVFYGEGYYPYVEFSYSTLNKEGYILNIDNIYYKMYVDGLEYTFTADEYYLDEDMTLVPVTFTDYYNFETEPGRNLIYLSFEGFETLGFKLFYCEPNSNGELEVIAESEMGLYQDESSKIDILENDDLAPVYFDLLGRKINRPSKGDFVIERKGEKSRKIIF